MATRRFTVSLPELAERHDGVVSRQLLLDAGFHDPDIRDGTARGHLTRVVRGIYVVGRARITQQQLAQAATLRGVPAMLRGRSAAEHRGLLDRRVGSVAVASTRAERSSTHRTLVPMTGVRSAPGLLTIHPTSSVAESELVDGVPTSPVPRMLLDIAAAEKASTLRHVWKQADYQGILDLAAVDRALRSGRRGSRAVRELLDAHPGRFGAVAHYKSPAEVDFRQLLADAGLPDPEVNVPFAISGRRYVADFLFRQQGVVVEVDDESHHRPLARERDAIRDADFATIGIVVVRFDVGRLRASPALCLGQLEAILELRRR